VNRLLLVEILRLVKLFYLRGFLPYGLPAYYAAYGGNYLPTLRETPTGLIFKGQKIRGGLRTNSGIVSRLMLGACPFCLRVTSLLINNSNIYNLK
jgi:hypothetical protein